MAGPRVWPVIFIKLLSDSRPAEPLLHPLPTTVCSTVYMCLLKAISQALVVFSHFTQQARGLFLFSEVERVSLGIQRWASLYTVRWSGFCFLMYSLSKFTVSFKKNQTRNGFVVAHVRYQPKGYFTQNFFCQEMEVRNMLKWFEFVFKCSKW